MSAHVIVSVGVFLLSSIIFYTLLQYSPYIRKKHRNACKGKDTAQVLEHEIYHKSIGPYMFGITPNSLNKVLLIIHVC